MDHNHTPHHLLGRHRRRRPRNTLRTTTNRHHLRLHTHGQHSIQKHTNHTAPNSTPKKQPPQKHATPKPTPGLTQHERNLYEQLCTGKNTTYLRIEQERIPINDAMTILHNQHQWNTTHHK
ncbi:Wadjet anti-phage system protein JetD domain-containing protein [Bifidobacterium pseudocatenulatum]|uniref:Wadjet anti-phage system protein JetD domain-containing protein n=1 Tax=Bifidobacterium pseudocatenulatum TaxID=28026 RepID=UPI00237857C2|nr:Wadjet anti-phage system protein JetD domain-containing protein [Bifidobacterium pseudocatenulatum]